MSNIIKCHRCLLPIVGTCYALRLDSDPPQPEALEVNLCINCVESLSRWLTRRSRHGDGFQSGEGVPDVEATKKALGRPSRGRGRYAAEIDQFEASHRRKLFWGVVLGTVALALAIAVVAYAVVATTPQSPRRVGGPRPAAGAPALAQVGTGWHVDRGLGGRLE